MATEIDTLQIQVSADSASAASQIDQLCASLQKLGTIRLPGLEQIDKRLKSIGGTNTPNLSKLEQTLSKTEAQAVKAGDALLELQNKLDSLQALKGIGNPLTNEAVDAQIRQTEAALNEVSQTVDNLDAKIHTLRSEIQASGQTAAQSVTAVNSSLQATVHSAQTVSEALKPASQACETLSSSVKTVSGSLEPAVGACANLSASAKAVENNLQGATTGAKDLGQALETASQKGSSGLASIGKSVASIAKRMVIFRLLSSLISGIGDSLGKMAAENEGVNSTLSEIMSSVQYVRDALASAIYPILKAIQPVLTVILDALASILSTIGRIISFFTGSDTFIQATKQQVNFAESVNGTTDALNGASAAAAGLSKQLLPFDELNIFDNSGGGGTSGTIGGLTFEEVPTDSFDFKLPDWLSMPIEFPGWTPDPVPAPAFELLELPEWALNPLPVPEWLLNPIPSPVLDTEPVATALETLQADFAYAWSVVTSKVNSGVQAVQGAYAQLKGSTVEIVESIQAKLQAWGTAAQGVFQKVSTFIPNVVAPALQNAANSFVTFASETSKDISAWASNVAANVRAAVAYVPEAVASGLTSAGEAIASWVNSTSSNVAAWGKNLIQNAGSAIKGFYENFVSGLSAAWESFTGFLKATGEKISGWWSANKSWVVPVAAGAGIVALTIGAVALSGGAALPAFAAALPALASGGVLTQPTAVLAGEYPGAKTNPEIVTPQNILRETFREEQNDEDLINVILASTQQIIAAIKNNSSDIYLDGQKVAARATAAQNRQNRMYGKTLQNA